MFDRLKPCTTKRFRAEQVVIFSETQSRPLTIHLAEIALKRLGLNAINLQLPTPPAPRGAVIRSTRASLALTGQRIAIDMLAAADIVVDLTVEALMHARETATRGSDHDYLE